MGKNRFYLTFPGDYAHHILSLMQMIIDICLAADGRSGRQTLSDVSFHDWNTLLLRLFRYFP